MKLLLVYMLIYRRHLTTVDHNILLYKLYTVSPKIAIFTTFLFFYVPRLSFFVCPGDAPVAITQNVA